MGDDQEATRHHAHRSNGSEIQRKSGGIPQKKAVLEMLQYILTTTIWAFAYGGQDCEVNMVASTELDFAMCGNNQRSVSGRAVKMGREGSIR